MAFSVEDGALIKWTLNTRNVKWIRPLHYSQVWISLDPQAKTMAQSSGYAVVVWSLANSTTLARFDVWFGLPLTSRSGEFVAISNGNKVSLWDRSRRSYQWGYFDFVPNSAFGVAFSGDSASLGATAYDGRTWISSLRSGGRNASWTVPHAEERVESLELNENASLAAVLLGGRVTKIYDVTKAPANGDEPPSVDLPTGTRVLFRPHHPAQFVRLDPDGALSLGDWPSLRNLRTLGHVSSKSRLYFSSKYLWTIDVDSICRWNLDNGSSSAFGPVPVSERDYYVPDESPDTVNVRLTRRRHRSTVDAVVDDRLAVMVDGPFVRFWDIARRRWLLELTTVGTHGDWVALTTDGRHDGTPRGIAMSPVSMDGRRTMLSAFPRLRRHALLRDVLNLPP